MQHKSKIPWLFYALVVYVLVQFLWWEILLTKQSKQLAEEQKEISALNISDKNSLEQNIQQIDKKKTHQLWMHVGEGTVFLILLSLGVLKIYNTRKKENELTRLQNNFLLSVTHELKSPLASVKLQLQTMQKHKLDGATQNSLLQKALADNERLLRLIDNILLASKTGNETPALNLREINLKETVAKLIEQSFAENKNRIQISSSENSLVKGDEQILAIIFSNLIENALKYSPADAKVEIEIQPGSICIKDTGPGIRDSEKQRVFDKFYRIGNEETRNAKGTGLGLYIVKNLCALHNIKLGLKDNIPRGAIFKLEFK
ncbi:MAG TPA: HAMP domain-containing sensor histidine kinase [Bacteroidia bacterium]|nr:HAMP domain-containing sensor histidine kinase [Bacteroidia bacterium]